MLHARLCKLLSASSKLSPSAAHACLPAALLIIMRPPRDMLCASLLGRASNITFIPASLDVLHRRVPCSRRERPRDWPTPAGLLNWVDEGEANRIMTYALSGGRLTWNVAVPWAAQDLEALGSRRYVSLEADAGDARQDPQAKLDRCEEGSLFLLE